MLYDEIRNAVQRGVVKKSVYFFHAACGGAYRDDMVGIGCKHGRVKSEVEYKILEVYLKYIKYTPKFLE